MNTLHVVSIEKYQPSYKDRRLLWIRWNVDTTSDYKFSQLTPSQKWLFIGLICLETSHQEPIPNDNNYIAHQLQYPKASISKDLLMLQKLGMIVTDCNNDCDVPFPTDRHTDRHTGACYSDIIDKWNAFAEGNGLSKVSVLTTERKSKIKARLEEGFDIDKVLAEADKQPFLLGRNDRGWKMDFDWLVRNGTNYVRVMELKYKGTQTGQEGRKL